LNTVTTLEELRQLRAQMPAPVGLVPTMGYLHAGHLSLVKTARTQCTSLIATIYVNPTQFGPKEDLSSYPRDVPRDLELLQAEGVDLVWMPTDEIMYPPGYQTWVSVEHITQLLEGKMRPSHFRGVTTIVAKLFNATQPQRAYFGQKDAQQAIVIHRMVRELNYPLEVIVCPTVREADGLAMSSRNVYLDPEQRRAASVLYRALTAAKSAFDAGERHPERLRQVVSQLIHAEPLAQLQYVSCANPQTLEELEEKVEQTALLSLAAFFGKTRLIDNIPLGFE
jgi:pantoate--beta-alanine ligase